MAEPIERFEDLEARMTTDGYDWEPETRVFVPREGGRATLSVRDALGQVDPERYLDRSDEVRDPPVPPVQWPPWAT